jgi:hypothetical protein
LTDGKLNIHWTISTGPKNKKSLIPFTGTRPELFFLPLIEDIANLKDPGILQMLQDPAFQNAVKEIKDPKQLATDPRTKKFYAHPEIKALLKKQQKPKKTKTASTTK